MSGNKQVVYLQWDGASTPTPIPFSLSSLTKNSAEAQTMVENEFQIVFQSLKDRNDIRINWRELEPNQTYTVSGISKGNSEGNIGLISCL